MQIRIRNRCSNFNSYRAARVKSLFNAESGCNFDLDADLDLSGDWSIGVVVGPSGSGKTSIGRQIFGEPALFWTPEWPADKPIIDAIAPEADFNVVTGALGSAFLHSQGQHPDVGGTRGDIPFERGTPFYLLLKYFKVNC